MKKLYSLKTAAPALEPITEKQHPQACAQCIARVTGGAINPCDQCAARDQTGRCCGWPQFSPAAGSGLSIPDPRETMRRLPDWLQPLLTALTGKALPGQEPWFRWSPAGRMGFTLASFLAAIALGAWAVQTGGLAWLVVPLAWLLVVSNTRIIQTGIVHHASHGTLLLAKFWNDLLGEFFSLLIWIQPLELYRRDHGPHHWETGSKNDPDLRFIVQVAGMRPGLTVPEYWRQFWRTLFSPRFHGMYLWARLRANFVEASGPRRVAAFVWVGALAAIAAAGFGVELFFAYLLPITVLTQMSAWAGLLGLHQWVREGDGERPAKEVLAGLTSGRFLGEAAPLPTLTGAAAVRAWAGWTTRMLFLHLPARVAIVPGDLPSHDWHHFHPKTRDWANAAYARRDELASTAPNARLYTELWGVKTAINGTFERFSKLPTNADLGEPLTYRERQSVLLAM